MRSESVAFVEISGSGLRASSVLRARASKSMAVVANPFSAVRDRAIQFDPMNSVRWNSRACLAPVLVLFLLMLGGCSTQAVSVTTFRPYEPVSTGEMKPARIEGIWGFFGQGVATAICGVDGKRIDPCVIAVELPPGPHEVSVRLMLAGAEIHRTYVLELEGAGAYRVVPKRMDDGTEAPVIEARDARQGD